MGGGGTLPSTGMWQGEVFAISDCLVDHCSALGVVYNVSLMVVIATRAG